MLRCNPLKLLLLCAALCGCSPTANQPSIEHGRLMEPLPNKTVVAGYFELQNPTDQPLELREISANVGDSVEIHRTLQQGDQVRMERIEHLTIPARNGVSFAPGGYHLMIFGVTALPEHSEITLHFADGQSLTATFTAQRW